MPEAITLLSSGPNRDMSTLDANSPTRHRVRDLGCAMLERAHQFSIRRERKKSASDEVLNFLRHLICWSSELRAFRSSRDCTESKDDHGQDDDREASEHGITVRADQHLSATKNQSSEC